MSQWKWAAIAAGCAVFLAGCGGASDGSDITPKSAVPTAKIFGDSIMDSGAFGYKFTVQSADPANPFLIFPEVVAANFGAPKLCAFFKFNGTTFVPDSACTSYAVGGGRINNLTNGTPALASNANPLSITYQMTVAAATLTPNDLVIVDGGGNDLADLTGAFLGATTQAGVGTYMGLLGTLLPQATVASLIGAAPTPTSLATAGGAYAQALGQALAASVKANVVAKNVNKIVVVNAPDITVTPRFLAVLTGVAAAAGTAQRDAVQTTVRAWTNAFNASLAANLADTKAQVFDLYTEGGRIAATPAQFAMTNITTPACPIVAGGTDSVTGQASLSAPATVAVCNPTYMGNNIPKGETSSNWWKGYAYSDNFHPTPALHQLVGQSINLQLAKAGWL
ncbi:MAG: phospholipase [Rhodoferax sp.]|nr:phospholipase [Rhodoferax sp.]MCF8210084.1 phospholipase [Rhodoferax sp.]